MPSRAPSCQLNGGTQSLVCLQLGEHTRVTSIMCQPGGGLGQLRNLCDDGVNNGGAGRPSGHHRPVCPRHVVAVVDGWRFDSLAYEPYHAKP
jgi:hypothetical protein